VQLHEFMARLQVILNTQEITLNTYDLLDALPLRRTSDT